MGKLRRWLLQDQALRTALAAALAWAAGGAIPGVSRPYFAPLAAILTVQVTVAASLTRAVQRTLGVVVGVLLALVAARAVGATALGIGLLVLAAMSVGAWLRLGPSGAPQVAVSALLVLVIGTLAGVPAYAWQRAVESAVGAATGVAVGALLVPPSGVPAARDAMGALAESLAHCLGHLAAGAPAGPSLVEARQLTRRAEAARAALHRAEESLLYNLWAGRQRVELERLRAGCSALERTAIQVRGIARVVDDLARRPDALPEVLRALARVVVGFWRVVEGGAEAEAWTGLAGAARAAQARAAAVGTPGDWVRMGSLLADADRLVADLAGAAAELSRSR